MLDDLTERVRDLISNKDPVGFDVKIDLAEVGKIFVAAKEAPIEVSNDDGDADVTLHMSAGDLRSVLGGQLNVTTAFMFGKIRIDGDMSKAMALTSLFS